MEGFRSRTSDRGFTLIELLTVLVIIAILLAVAVPLFLQSQVAAREAAAMAALRTMGTACEQLRAELRRYGTRAELGATGLLSHDLAAGEKGSYVFEVFVDPTTWTCQFHAQAVPRSYISEGVHSYHVDESGAIRERDTGGNGFTPRAIAETWPETGE